MNIIDKIKGLTKKQKWIAIGAAALAVVIAATCILLAVGRGGAGGDGYSVTITNQAGTPLVGVEVYIYRDKNLNDLISFAKTDSEGKAVLTEKPVGCVAVLKGVPAGYVVDPYYSINSKAMHITLQTALQTDVDLSKIVLRLGDVMSDFTVTDGNGQEYTLSALLKEKNAVVLNFWFISCDPCASEFPSLQAAYDRHSDTVALLAMNPVDTEAEAVEQYRTEHQLTFPMVVCEPSWQTALQIAGYPTTVVVDRYGMITFMHTNPMSEEDFDTILSFFGAEDYVQTIAGDLDGLKMIIANADASDESSTDDSTDTSDNSDAAATGDGGTTTDDGGDNTDDTGYNGDATGSQTTSDNTTGGKDPTTGKDDAGNTGATVGTGSGATPITSTTSKDADGSSADKAIEVGGTLLFDAVVPAGGKTYYNVYKVSGTTLTIEDKNAYVVYNGKTYEPVNGVVEVPVTSPDVNTPVKIAVGNKGKTAATFRVTCVYPGGTQANPFVLNMGGLTTNIKKGNDQGVVYLYTATQAGTVQLYVDSATAGVKYDVMLYNLNTYANRTLEADGVKNSAGKTVVSVDVNAGDKVQVTVSVLPDKNNEYPAATIKSQLTFVKAGEGVTTTTKPQLVTYSATVKDQEGKGISGVSLKFAVGDNTQSVTTNASGYASAELPAGECTVTLIVPAGYIADRSEYKLSAALPALDLVLEKEKSQNDGEGTTPTEYTVKVLDGDNKPQTGVIVQFYLGNTKKGEQKVDSQGVAKITLLDAAYTIKLTGTDLRWDEKAAVVTPAAPSIDLLLAPYYNKDSYELVNNPETGKNVRAYYIGSGTMYVDLKAGSRNYFLFEPTEAGTYRITTTNTYAKVGYYGGSIHYIQSSNLAEKVENNAFTVSVKEPGPTFVLGVDAATNMTGVILHVTRVGDAEWSVDAEPWQTYVGAHTPKPYTLSLGSGQSLTNLDLTADKHTLVYNESDGYYHLNSKSGPVVYVRFNDKAPHISFADILSKYHMGAYLYDNNGNFLRKEEYTECMTQYVSNMDATAGVYPLTKDLEYIIKHYGEHQGWWDPNSPTYLFDELTGVNLDLAWMFALCYVK